MEKSKIYVFIDDVFSEYIKYYGSEFEQILVGDLKKYFKHLSKDSEITLITRQNFDELNGWLSKYDLCGFVAGLDNFIV